MNSSVSFVGAETLIELVLTWFSSGEQGQVDESMREMAAIEALKSEKADKEVSLRFHLTVLTRFASLTHSCSFFTA